MPASRRRYRPPVGFPAGEGRRGRWQASIISIVLHALALFLVLVPAVASVSLAVERQSWGKHGLVLGGGGGGQAERVQYLHVAPPPPTPVRRPVVRRPPPKPQPRVIAPPPVIPPPPKPPPPAPTTDTTSSGAAPGAGSTGAGPGSGGGTGSGKGTGAGAATGPGTAGDPAARKLRAMAPETIVAGLDAPKAARPRHLIAVFIVDRAATPSSCHSHRPTTAASIAD